MKVQGKVIVVTGAGNGIGRELTLALLAKGASVAGTDINAAALDETRTLAKDAASRFKSYVCDISKLDQVNHLFASVVKDFTAVDGLINNAGIIQPFVKFNDLGHSDIERVMNINFYGTLYMTKTFLPQLLTRPVAHIMNVSSMGGFLPVPGQTIYGASKAAVKLFTEGLYAELLGTRVRVTVVFPGAIGTNIVQNSGLSLPKVESTEASATSLPPSIAAQIMIEAMEDDKYRVLVGKDAKFMDTLTRLNPRRATRFIAEKMKSLLGS